METTNYRIIVDTGDMDGAGTDANVFLTIFGSNGSSDERQLDNSQDNFEQGSSDNFDLETLDLGDLIRLRVRRDNSGPRPGWFLKRIVVRNEFTNQMWTFPCDRWFAKDEPPFSTDQNLTLS